MNVQIGGLDAPVIEDGLIELTQQTFNSIDHPSHIKILGDATGRSGHPLPTSKSGPTFVQSVERLSRTPFTKFPFTNAHPDPGHPFNDDEYTPDELDVLEKWMKMNLADSDILAILGCTAARAVLILLAKHHSKTPPKMPRSSRTPFKP